MMVEKSSALLKHRQGVRLMVDGDHSQIAKLSRGQGGAYPNVLRVIKQGLQSASETYAVYNKEQVKPDNNTPPETTPPASRMPSPEPSEVVPENPVEDVATTSGMMDTLFEDEQAFSGSEEEPVDEYEIDNFMTCDECLAEFPKWLQHSVCIICEDGDFILCQSCQNQGYSCPERKHQLYPRQLPKPEEKRNTKIGDHEIRCDWCLEDFGKSETHSHCDICSDGNFDLCVGCKRLDAFCPGKHELYERKITRRSKDKTIKHASPQPQIQRQPSPQPPTETSNPTCFECNTIFPSRNKLFEHIKQSNLTGDLGFCVLTQSLTPNLTCEKCKRNFPSRNKLFQHLVASKHEDWTRNRHFEQVEQNDLAGGNFVPTQSSTSNQTCEKCMRNFPSRNKLFEHLVASRHGDWTA